MNNPFVFDSVEEAVEAQQAIYQRFFGGVNLDSALVDPEKIKAQSGNTLFMAWPMWETSLLHPHENGGMHPSIAIVRLVPLGDQWQVRL